MKALNDFHYALRLLIKKPGFTVLTIAVMALGIGVSLFLFSFFHSMLFKDLPFNDGERLFQLNSSRNGVTEWGGVNLHDYYEIRTTIKGIAEFGAYRESKANVSGRDGARQYDAVFTEPTIFQMTRTQPLMGRGFTEAENQVGAESIVVIGYDVWQVQFGADPEVLNQTLRINGASHRVVGVMPQGYTFPRTADLWLPMREDATQLPRGGAGNSYGILMLDRGVSIKDVNSQLAVIMQRIASAFPKTNSGISAYATTFPMTAVRDGIAVVYAMQIAAILILCLASINVGNLLFSRAIERGKETAIRVALGAPRIRLIGQMLWESLIICSIGGFIGLLVLAWGLEVAEAATLQFFNDKKVFWWDFGVDTFTLKLFVLFILVTVIATGLLPAWRNSGADFNAVLRDGTRGAVSKRSGRLHQVLVISEIFLSITVLIAAAVMVVGAYKASHADFGVNTENILTAKVRLLESDYANPDQQAQFVQTLQSRLENVAGIGNVMIASSLPGEWGWAPTMAVEGKTYTDNSSDYPRANYISITPGSLAKLGVELTAGRYFNSGDNQSDVRTVIVTDSFVSRYLAGEFPVGKRIRIVRNSNDKVEWLTIVGVVKHTIYGQSNDETGKTPVVFRPFVQVPRNFMTIAMEMKSGNAAATRGLRKTLEAIDPELPAFQVEEYADIIKRSNGPLSFVSKIFLLMGIVATVLAASGIYGVMSNTINQKTHEIGIRRALGASDEKIRQQFLMIGFKQLLWGAIPGLLAGCAMALAMSRIVGLARVELLIISALMLLIIGSVVMLATWWPTQRALRLEPGEALRYE